MLSRIALILDQSFAFVQFFLHRVASWFFMLTFCVFSVDCSDFGCQYQCSWFPGKTCLLTAHACVSFFPFFFLFLVSCILLSLSWASSPPNASNANSPSSPFPSSFRFPSLSSFLPSLFPFPNTLFPFPSSLFPLLSLSPAAKRPPEIGKGSGGAL